MRAHVVRLRRPSTYEEYQLTEEVQTKRGRLRTKHYISEHMPSVRKQRDAERPIFLVRYE